MNQQKAELIAEILGDQRIAGDQAATLLDGETAWDRAYRHAVGQEEGDEPQPEQRKSIPSPLRRR